ncbi:MAG TPA: glycosyl hydrolase 108 family protein, partial [Clostridia bacterium]|nr:glycosyl hydrolase 108 family protein [Clostridia bacterium]
VLERLRFVYTLAGKDTTITTALNSFVNHPDVKKFLDGYRAAEHKTEIVDTQFDDFNRFKKILQFTLKWEGGFVDDPDDPGGRTNYGITQATFDAYRKSKGLDKIDVKNISPGEVELIYFKNYWIPAQCPRMVDSLAYVIFDTAVNFGVGGSVEFLQEALEIAMDGQWGKVTEKAYNNQTLYDLKNILPLTIVKNRKKYRQLRVLQNPTQEKFLRGWLNRDEALEEFVKNIRKPDRRF